MRYCALVLAIVVVGCLGISVLRQDRGSRRTTKSEPLEVTTVLRPVPAILNEGTLPPIAGTETKIIGKAGTPFAFRRAQFIDENHGWVMGNYSLYRTTDGGKSWERLENPKCLATYS